jgi:hypothetical protein
VRWTGVTVMICVLGCATALLAQPAPVLIKEDGRFGATVHLSQAQPAFAVPFTPARDGVHLLSLELSKPVAATLRVTGKDRDPLEESGEGALSLEFEAQRAVPCTLSIALQPPVGPTVVTAELAVLFKLGEGYSKRPLNPAIAGEVATAPAPDKKRAMLPVILQLHARHRDGATDLNEYDLAYARALEEMSEEDRAGLDALADMMAQTPPEKLGRRYVSLRKGPGEPLSRQDIVRAIQVDGPTLAPALQIQAKGPRIMAGKEPEEGFNPGDEVLLGGVGFGTRADRVKIEIWSPDPKARSPHVLLAPTEVTPGLLRFALPEDLKAGIWRANVLMGKLTSNQVTLPVGQARSRKGAALPSATGMYFNNKGRTALTVQGLNFQPGEPVMARIHTEDPLAPQSVMLDATALSETAVQVDLESYLPDFRHNAFLEIISVGATTEPRTLYTADVPRYKVIFDTVQCKDESNPEKTWPVSCHDEVVTFWLVQADNDLYTRNTGMYSGFDDGDMQTYDDDGPVLTPWGDWHPVAAGIVLNTQLFEWDEGDVHAARGALNGVATAVKWIVRFACPAYGEIIGGVCEMVAYIAGDIVEALWGAPEILGESTEPFTAEVLDQICSRRPGEAGPAVASRVLDYNNSDRTGSYQLKYRILQDKPGAPE